MGTSVVNDLWLARREGAALFGWGTSITGPQASRVDVTSTHDRHHFVGWPAGWVVKKASGCGNSYGKLWLEVKTTYKWTDWYYNALSGLSYWSGSSGYPGALYYFEIGGPPGPIVYDPESFPNGDGHVYQNFDWYSNNLTTGYYTSGSSSLGSSTLNGPYTGYDDGGLEAYNYNDGVVDIYFGNWSSKMTPSDIFTWADGLDAVITVEATHNYYVHDPAGSHWNRSASVTVNSVNIVGSPSYDLDYINDGIVATFLMDEDWTATGRLENLTCKFRWRYDPQSSVGCKWWAGKVVSAKVFYKKALVTKTDGPDGVFYSLGTWVSGGDSTQSLTLQDSYSAAYVASEVTMPTEEGYVYVIDDIEVLSVT